MVIAYHIEYCASWSIHALDAFLLQLLCYLFLWCPFFFDAEARIDLGKSVIDKEVVEKVGYINI